MPTLYWCPHQVLKATEAPLPKYASSTQNIKKDAHLAWADFKIKFKQIMHSRVHFDQWNLLVSKMLSLKIFAGFFLYSDQHARNFIKNKNDEKSIIKSLKN